MTGRWDKFFLLMWKNWLLHYRHKLSTIIEIFIPVIFSLLLLYIRSVSDPKYFSNSTSYTPLSIDNIESLRSVIRPQPIDMKFIYSPENLILEDLLIKSSEIFKIKEKPVAFLDAESLEKYLYKENPIAGIVFDDNFKNLTELPDKIEYKIRLPGELRTYWTEPIWLNWHTDSLFPLFQMHGPRNREDNDGGLPPSYHHECFLQIQHAISKVFIEIKSNITVPEIYVQRFPYPPFTSDNLLTGLENFVSIIILLSFVYPCNSTVKFITHEKEKQLKETMKIMGLSSLLHWSAWFIKSLIFKIISITFIVIIFKIKLHSDNVTSILTYTNWSILWMLLFIYSITTIMFCFMLSVLFSNANTAAAVSGVVWFIFYCPYTITQENYEYLSLGDKMFVSLFSNSAMAYAFRLILRLEGTHEGLNWGNLWRTVTPDDNISVGLIMFMLVVDAFLYLLITLYIEKIFPGDFGVPEKWYFPFTKTFWYGDKIVDFTCPILTTNNENIEADPIGNNAGVKINNLRKVYSNKKVAVKGLTLNMYEDQITVILGNNGAGKTTIMSMLTGMLPPTSGTAIINNKDIRSNIDGVRSFLGFCPQHNILFDDLTVREHIIFYSKLKGLKNIEIDNEIVKYVELLELQPKIDIQVSKLSGGMQRKLSVGVALCGNSKVVICDEPTSGMDPAARRFLWNLLQKEKKGRTILLTTHFMDEADILGDRIAILSNGELKAIGSPFFLKKKFGAGYHLICVKGDRCNVNMVTNLLRKYVPLISIQSDVGSELSYQLLDKYSSVYETMLKDLEDNFNELGISNYGISPTSLEEVYLKIAGNEKNGIQKDFSYLNNSGGSFYEMGGSACSSGSMISNKLFNGSKLIENQIIAMFEKKFWCTIRNWIMLLLQISIPIMFIILTILIVRSWGGGSDLPPFKIDISSYGKSVTVLERNPKDLPGSFSYNTAKQYESMFCTSSSQKEQLEVIDNNDFETYILNLDHPQSQINTKYLVGATIKETKKIIVWFNNQAFHSAPITLNLIHNAILKSSGCGQDCQINVINQPMPFRMSSWVFRLKAGNNMGFQLSFNIGFAMSFVSAFYVLFYIRERVSCAKLLQFVSGVNLVIFWITAFLWDFFTFIITVIFTIITLAIFQEDGWSSFSELGRTFILFLCYGFSMLPFNYLASQLFHIPSSGFTRIVIFNIFSGIACFCVVFVLGIPAIDLQDTADTLTTFFLIFPHFSLSEGLNKLNTVNTISKTCSRCVYPCMIDQMPICSNLSYFGWQSPGVGRNITYLILVGLTSFIILFLLEYQILTLFFYKCKNYLKPEPKLILNNTIRDVDVITEKNRVNGMSFTQIKQNNLIIKNMTKFYNKFLAVNQISLCVKHSECFGLLGINGAGKSSTFKMLTGTKISHGEAYVNGISVKTNINNVYKDIGYCPQFDAIFNELTGRETMRIFCLLRGIQRSLIDSVIIKLANDLNFIQYIDKKVHEYSGGNKRKLSTSIAFIGNPTCIYLDEPSTGCDPTTKRQLWNVISKIRNSGKSIVLTSHSMEECEAVCTRLSIMVNGDFQCLGSPQYLKNKFSKGFLLMIKLKKLTLSPYDVLVNPIVQADRAKIKEFIFRCFPGSYLIEENQGMLSYSLPIGVAWSIMFGIMEHGKKKLNLIEDYSLNQTSLEQVFLAFTKYQNEENRISNTSV